MRKSMIIVAGGSGLRMGSAIPKQFLLLHGKPVLMHTLQNLHSIDAALQLVLVLPRAHFQLWDELKRQHAFSVPHLLAEGGDTRFLSVKNGLQHVTSSDVVGVHDGVRPFVSEKLLEDCFSMAYNKGAAIPVIPLVESLRMLMNGHSKAVDRTAFRAVQTPQCFKTDILKKAFETADRTDYSDDATVVEAMGHIISLTEGDRENIKITEPVDLELAHLIVSRRSLSK